MEEKKSDFPRIISVGKKGAEKYVLAIIRALQPVNFEKYGELRINVTDANQQTAEYVMNLFKSLGIVEETDRKKILKEIMREDGTSYPLEVIEIVLKKPPKWRH